jgi:hypothetical protein
MKFYQRFAYYLVGLVIGCFFVAMVLSGKDTRCNYFPNARVLNDLSTKPFNVSDIAAEKLKEKWVDMNDIKNTLKYGDVVFDKSNVKYGSGKIYIVEGKTINNQPIVLEFINYADKVVLKDIIKK